MHACDRCHEPRFLLADTFRGRLCPTCWFEMGQPGARVVSDVQAIHEAQLRTRERMHARGGTDRHLVRNGRT